MTELRRRAPEVLAEGLRSPDTERCIDMRPIRVLVASALLLTGIAGGVARAETVCQFGGITPSASVARVDLPTGSDVLNLSFTVAPPTYAAGDRSAWHFIEGVAVIDASDGTVVASRMASYGSSPRDVVVSSSGVDERQEFTGPDAPFQHTRWNRVSSLNPGTYYIVAFASDGDDRLPNAHWGVQVGMAGNEACAPAGSGSVFDVDQTGFTGGTQVSAYAAGYADSISWGFDAGAPLVFGVIDAGAQLAGTTRVTYAIPTAQGSVSNDIIPFSGTAGRYRFDASDGGPFPLVDVAGVAVQFG